MSKIGKMLVCGAVFGMLLELTTPFCECNVSAAKSKLTLTKKELH